MDVQTVTELAEEMIRDLEVGFDGTGIRSGIIGEIGVSHPIADNEKKVLRAAGQAQKSTGATIIHSLVYEKVSTTMRNHFRSRRLLTKRCSGLLMPANLDP